ncbi:predicted protein [Chaetomium globosum CBS 148.51]|uniref:Uncharacterized protein n=1 Tax=Chaetomium globosum (strain ATCC 6205 / CBS 148.51 / DSM 1962 / NBRC 6347 / NRRL 1970) TaxID=306901 RepID=Q2H2Z8_CHAGB|nr:uncharacterized protein CHGG_03848 [Chaetomium globosum CBS 148.51]EAQ87229.1 predicted protein [Chaetomium globosum CBS 148.51]
MDARRGMTGESGFFALPSLQWYPAVRREEPGEEARKRANWEKKGRSESVDVMMGWLRLACALRLARHIPCLFFCPALPRDIEAKAFPGGLRRCRWVIGPERLPSMGSETRRQPYMRMGLLQSKRRCWVCGLFAGYITVLGSALQTRLDYEVNAVYASDQVWLRRSSGVMIVDAECCSSMSLAPAHRPAFRMRSPEAVACNGSQQGDGNAPNWPENGRILGCRREDDRLRIRRTRGDPRRARKAMEAETLARGTFGHELDPLSES